MTRPTLLVAAALAALCAALPAAAAKDAAADRPITKLLPQARNHRACFTARFGDGGVALAQPEERLQSLTAELFWRDIDRTNYGDGVVGFNLDRSARQTTMTKEPALRPALSSAR